MLTSILPGLRDVRTPLACGYMWLVAAWLAFADHLPRTRPSAGIAASFWDLGGHVGKAAIFAAITFSAYLIGAILEFDPAQLWRSRGIPSAASVLRSFEFGGISIKLAELEQAELDQDEGNRPDSAPDVVAAGDMNQEGEKSKAPEGPVITADQVKRETQRVERSVESLREAASGSGGVETMQALATALQARSTMPLSLFSIRL